MGTYTLSINDEVMQEFKEFVLQKYGKLHKKLGETATKALKEFLERHASTPEAGKPRSVSDVVEEVSA